jgi:hypothetical protein
VTLYNRFVTPQNVGAASETLQRASEGVKGVARAFYTLLVGPNDENKVFVLILLGTSVLVWIVLWLMARFGQR